ncbi:pisatin demethylase (Cytochrome-P450) [Teratosphaeria destructans]|uniref:Pisatin demethylase (Cytochrome-P450) n=1 Tax=Teratosphaeria destructans TaxID=418781 RepID=A0A9W7SIR4_9PEZI|nr:pisatin demethylase (Cytochrome-P450) [Teratosphaeria destructans]
MLSTLLLVAIALFASYVARSIHTYAALRHFGGHWTAGWSRLWLLRTQGSGEMHKRFTAINREYGSTARIAPRMLITTSPALLLRMSAVRSPFTRGPWYAALKLHPERDNITSYIDERKHAEIRNRMAPGYSGKENPQLEQDVDEQLLKLLALLERKYLARPDEGDFRVVDISRETSFFTLDVISKVAFGETFGFLEEDDDPFGSYSSLSLTSPALNSDGCTGYLENLSQFLPAIIVFGVYTELTNLMKIPLVKAALPKSTDKRGLGRVMGFARDRVQERFGRQQVKRQDMLNSFISRGLTQAELESETLTQITAGSDSTASALRIILHFVSTTPPVLSRLLAEAESAIAGGRISRPVIRDAEARQLPYLQACIKEGLRIYPPVTGLMAKKVPDGGCMIDVDGVEKFVPGGTQIGWNSWGMMREEEVFGADAEIFRPERWLPRDGSEREMARITRMTETVTLCFGSGRFGCLGRGVAVMELNKAVIEVRVLLEGGVFMRLTEFRQILRRFSLQPCSLARPFEEKVVGFYIHEHMDFVLTERRDVAAGRDDDDGGVQYGAAALPGAPEA